MRYDVIVIGSGQAGVPLAARMAEGGQRVLIAERAELGGTCVNDGCTPTKTMIASARAAHVARNGFRLGVRAGEVTVDLAAVVDRKDRIVRQFREGVQKRLARAGERLTLLRGQARFTGERQVEVGGQRYEAETIVVNVGCRAAIPEIAGLEGARPLDNASVMGLRELPRHLVVLGGGYVGCELAQMFRRFGSEVTVIDRGDHLLGHEDPEVSAAIEDVFRAEGIRLELGAGAREVSGGPGDVVLRLPAGKEVRGSHLLVAVGRRPNTDDLGCEAAGVERDTRGFIPVDDRYRTRASGVYAVGDVTGGPQFTHASWDDHRILFDLLRGRGARTRNQRLIPVTAFTDPQVARVGLTEKEARQRGLPCEVATMPFGGVARAIETDETAGVMKVLLDPATERILGAAIVGAEAGELIHVFVPLMQAGGTARAMVEAEYVHPTFAEGLQTLVMKLKRYALS